MLLADIHERNATLFAQHTALICGGRHFSYSEFYERARRLAAALSAAGVRRQDRVAVLAQNRAEVLEAYAAAHIAGFILVPLNYRLAIPELLTIVADCQPAALIFDDNHERAGEEIRAQAGSFRLCLRIGGPRGDVGGYEEALAAVSLPLPKFEARAADIAVIIYTSGTTGRPKGVMHDNAGLAATARGMSVECEVRADDRHLMVMPLFHSGAMCKHLAYVWRGATIILHSQFDPAALLAEVAREQVTALHLAPVMVQMVMAHPSFSGSDLRSLRAVHYASAPMPVEHLKRAIVAFGPIFIQFYGSTEVLLGTVLHAHEHRPDGTPQEVRRLASAGKPFIDARIKILGDDGSEAEVGEVGELALQTPGMTRGYWNNNAATIDVNRDGWFRSGDAGMIDDDGYLYIVDRKKDMIVSGGENIYPREVEEALHSHPAIEIAAVIGVPDEVWGEAVKAFVKLRTGLKASEDDVIAHVRARIASYKKPKSVEFVDAFPRGPTGKIDKKKLREPYWAGRRQV
jgi:acyl-CoA synthetase (AMP-forming)/AMP-acid ligase II